MKKTTFALSLAAAFLINSSYAASGDAAAGKDKSQTCAACHGADGNSASADFPRLGGQHADYIESALHQYKSGGRKNAIMSGFAATLSDKDIADLAAYFSSQQGLAIKY
jgi:cytochrome c553